MLCDPASRSKNGKLHRPWSGPHQVIEKVTDALYRLRPSNGKEVIANVERLKKFYSRGRTEGRERRVSVSSLSDSEEENDIVFRPEEVEDYQAEEAVLPPADPPAAPPAGPHVNPAIEPPAPEVRNQGTPEPLMRGGGRLWCNVDAENVIQGKRR